MAQSYRLWILLMILSPSREKPSLMYIFMIKLCYVCFAKAFLALRQKYGNWQHQGQTPSNIFCKHFGDKLHSAHIGVMRYVIARRRPRKIRDRFSNVLQEETNDTIFIQFKTPKKWHAFEQKSPP